MKEQRQRPAAGPTRQTLQVETSDPLEGSAAMGNSAMLEQLGLQQGVERSDPREDTSLLAAHAEQPAGSAVDQTARDIMAYSSGHDTQALYGLYAEDATFSGPVFGEQDAMGNLGKLSTEHDGTNAVIEYDPEYESERLDDGTTRVSISWVADYKLAWAEIHNEVVSHFVIDDSGKILSQVDVFDKARWLEQMFSFLPAGGREWVRKTFLTPFMERTLRGKGEELADEYARQEPSGA